MNFLTYDNFYIFFTNTFLVKRLLTIFFNKKVSTLECDTYILIIYPCVFPLILYINK